MPRVLHFISTKDSKQKALVKLQAHEYKKTKAIRRHVKLEAHGYEKTKARRKHRSN